MNNIIKLPVMLRTNMYLTPPPLLLEEKGLGVEVVLDTAPAGELPLRPHYQERQIVGTNQGLHSKQSKKLEY
jgi:hypothetical protein